MLCSFLLRLVPDALAERRIAGHIEVIETGETARLRDAEELIAFLYDRGDRRVEAVRQPQIESEEGS